MAWKRFFVVMHFQRIENALKSIHCVLKRWRYFSMEMKSVANPFHNHFQNIFHGLSNTDKAFDETAVGYGAPKWT